MQNKLVALVSLALVACSKSPSDINTTYVERLSSVIEVKQPNDYHDTFWYDRNVTKPKFTSSISVLELAKMQHCELASLIAEHNNQLGKLAQPSIEFDYHLAFITNAQLCSDKLKSNNLTTSLNTAVNEKRNKLMHFFSYALESDPHLKYLYLPATHSLAMDKTGDKSSYLDAIKALSQLKNKLDTDNFSSINPSELTGISSLITPNNYGARLIRALREQIYLTNALTSQMHKINIARLCKQNHSNESAEVLANIFTKYYAGKLQAYHGELISEGKAVLPLLSDLYSNNQIVMITTLPEQLKQASKAHALWWQGFYKKCNLIPAKQY